MSIKMPKKTNVVTGFFDEIPKKKNLYVYTITDVIPTGN